MRTLGAKRLSDNRYLFTVCGFNTASIDLHLLKNDRYIPMQRDVQGYYRCVVDDVGVGDTYFYRISHEKERPDPASRHQPHSVHGASAVIDEDFTWTDQAYMGSQAKSATNIRAGKFER